MTTTAARPDTSGWYVFAGVAFCPARHLLLIDGNRRDAQPLVLRLLTLLCEAHGRVLPRAEQFERLWPRQQTTDESLTQLTARLREALGPYAAMLVTVRRVGLRLDADIRLLPAAEVSGAHPVGEPEPSEVPAESLPTTAATSGASTRQVPHRMARWIAILVVALLGLYGTWSLQRAGDAPVPGGRGLTEQELASVRADTAEAVRRALQWELEGRRDESQVLLELAHQSDPDSALPAIYLAFLAESQGRLKAVRDWKAQAQARLQRQPSMRLSVLLNLLDETNAAPSTKALTNLRVAAEAGTDTPALRLGRAYTHLARVERAEALAELQGLDLAALDPQEMPGAIADLAALGDPAAARAALAKLRARLSPSVLHEIDARMAASRQDWPQAVAMIDAALAADPDARAKLRQLTRAAFYRAQLGDYPGARERFRALLGYSDPTPSPLTLHNTYIMLAGLPDSAPASVREWLQLAASNADANAIASGCWEIELVAGLQKLPADWQFNCQAPSAAEQAEFAGLAPLRAALGAYRTGDDAGALRALASASAAGIDATLFGPHASALAAILGESNQAQPVDPPYPTWSRHVAYWHQREHATQD